MNDDAFMQRALAIAAPGVGRTLRNPSVGCVIVNDGVVVGEGATGEGGRPHAEELALAVAGDKARGATVYVTLEPCARRSSGASSCSYLLLQAGVARVVIATTDPHPFAAGTGVAWLRAAGIEVIIGVREVEARAAMVSFLSAFNDIPTYKAGAAARDRAFDDLPHLLEQLRTINAFAPGWRAETAGLRNVSAAPGLGVFKDTQDREWIVFDGAGAAARVEVALATAPLSPIWSAYDAGENLRAWTGCFYDIEEQITKLLETAPTFSGYFEDEGFPEHENALFLARWQTDAGSLMIHFGGEEYFGHPNKRFRLALSRSHERYSREMSRLWRSWTIEAKP